MANKFHARCFSTALSSLLACSTAWSSPPELRVGIAEHAFDHLGSIGDQAAAAAASGSTIIYATGVGTLGYAGLPPADELQKQCSAEARYVRQARSSGISLVIGYVCATSMVKLGTFDKNWPPEFKKSFRASPSDWRQQDRKGQALPSWYGGDYTPACMNNPDWRAYEHAIVKKQIENGCDGIFFDNPTVHPKGCYCSFCMEKFEIFLKREGLNGLQDTSATDRIELLRSFADKNANAFLRFRATIAADFLGDMRRFARTVKPTALITANNSLNSPGVLFSQTRTYGYNIYEMSKAEDLVVVEDEGGMPRTLSDGRLFEYAPTYKQLNAISHGKPVVAVTLAESDYHTPPNLVRLAMAEAVANGSSYLGWPTWPEAQRERMIKSIRPEADFLKEHAALLNDVRPRCDVLLFLPFRRWLQTAQCKVSAIAAQLSAANIQYRVICEDDFLSSSGRTLSRLESRTSSDLLGQARVLLIESESDFIPPEKSAVEHFRKDGGQLVTADASSWMNQLRSAMGRPSISTLERPEIRVVVADQRKETMVHLLNLNVMRVSSFEDKVTPATNVHVTVTVPSAKVSHVRVLTADHEATSGPVEFSTAKAEKKRSEVTVTIPRVDISSILVID